METVISEKIQVLATFSEGQIKPIIFKWHNRVYKILKIAFSYSKNIGKDKIFYFSVETEGGAFEISFNREKFWWEIEKTFD